MSRPLIGITSAFLQTPQPPLRLRHYLNAAYTDAVYAAGGLPLPLPVLEDYDARVLDELLARCDGLLLTGGHDLHPGNYGAALHPAADVLHERRDRFELDLLRRADAARMPIFAICLGHQVVHVARGGRLHQHVDDLNLAPAIVHYRPDDSDAFHPVRIAPDSTLARIVGATALETNSRHHQIVDPAVPARGLRPVAWSPDGVVEAAEDCAGRFLVSVQWHPEDQIDRPQHLALFQALVAAAGAARPTASSCCCR